MNKAFIAALSIALTTSHVHAASLKSISLSLLKCSWHITKIGGGVVCLATSTVPFGVSAIAHKLPKMPDFTNSPEDQERIHDYFVGVANEINGMNKKNVITPDHIAQAETWYQNNQATIKDWGGSFNQLKGKIRNQAGLFFIAYCAAGTASIWNGCKGLYKELINPDNTQEKLQDTTTSQEESLSENGSDTL